MNALREQVELLYAVDGHGHLAVEHELRRLEREHLLDHVEVAVHRASVAALEVHVVAVPEHDRAKPSSLGS